MPPAAPQQNQSDSSLGFLWVIVGIFALALLIWYVGHDYIVYGFLKFKLGEIWLVSLFTDSVNLLQSVVEALILQTHQVSFEQLDLVSVEVGNYLRIPCALILGVFAFLIYLSSVSIKFKQVYSMKSLMNLERQNWPQITPVTKLDLVKEPIDQGPWAMSTPPLIFAKKYNLLREETLPLMEDALSKELKVIAILKRQPATRIFSMQLGELWQGPERLPIHIRALFAIFAARGNHDTEASSKILTQIAVSSLDGKLNFTGVDALLRKYRTSKIVKVIEARHAYVLTLMASMLEIARADGVLASSEFLWLKPLDRKLWYTLNTVGRQVAPTEVAGIYAHWITEKKIGRCLVVPMVEEATNALEQAIQDIAYKPDEKAESS